MGRRKRPGAPLLFALGAVVLLLSASWSLCAGVSGYSLWDMLSSLLSGGGTAAHILLYVRLPRTLAALAAGAGLAVSGAIIQTVLANPMAGPSIVGVNAGAGFAVALCLALFPTGAAFLPLAAFTGALGAMLLISFVARKTWASKTTLILAGVVINALLGSASDAVFTLWPDALLGASAFKIGSFAGVNLRTLLPAVALIVLALALALCLGNEMDVLALGDDTARSLGLPVSRTRFLLLLCAAALAGASVSFAGLVGFVGLIVPHALRLAAGGESRRLLPLSILYGASFTLLCDTACRLLFAPYEFPVGIALSFLGTPFFLWLLLRNRRRRAHD